MPNTNPPDKINNRKAPAYRDIDAPDANALQHQVANPHQHDHDQGKRHGKTDVPAAWRAARQDNGTDPVSDRGIRMPRGQNRRAGITTTVALRQARFFTHKISSSMR